MTDSIAAMVSGPDLRMASVASTDLALKEEMVDMAECTSSMESNGGLALLCGLLRVARRQKNECRASEGE